MPLLDITIAQAYLQNHLSSLRAQSCVHCKLFSSPFTFRDEKRPLSIQKSFHFPRKPNTCYRTKLQIKAVATLEPKSSVKKEDGFQLEGGSEVSTVDAEADTSDVDEKELLRRTRISKANKGNTPWNKGRKHSPETLRKIRERTKLAMQNPKVMSYKGEVGQPWTFSETRSKIGVGVRMTWQKRREKIMVQESCYYEWQNLIAEASRRGCAGEEEMQWDSYKILREKLEVEWVESIEQRKTMPRLKGSKRAPKSPEQRRKIAEAIAAKWADPPFICVRIIGSGFVPHSQSTMEHKLGLKGGRGEKTSAKPKANDPSKSKNNANNLTKNDAKNPIQHIRLRSKAPVYKDPMAKSKLQMIKNIRAQRTATETKKTEAIERARLYIAEAEKAAKALEFAATKSPVAQEALVETRKLIAEAIQLLESTNSGHINQAENELTSSNGSVAKTGLKEANGTEIFASSKDGDLNFTKLSLLNGKNCSLSSSTGGYRLLEIQL